MFSLPSVEGILQWGFWDKARSTWNKMVKIKSYDTGSLAGERRIGERGRLWSKRGWPGLSWPLPQVRNDSWCNYNDKPFWDFLFSTTSAVSFEFISSNRLIKFCFQLLSGFRCREWNSSAELQPGSDGSFTTRWLISKWTQSYNLTGVLTICSPQGNKS